MKDLNPLTLIILLIFCCYASLEESQNESWVLRQTEESPWIGIIKQKHISEMYKNNGLEKPPEFVGKEEPRFESIPLKDILKSDKRLLVDQNNLTNPGIIGFDKQSKGKYEYYAYKYIFTNLKMYQSNLVLYPYNFSYVQNESTIVNFTQGAVFSLAPDALPISVDYDYFSSIAASSNVLFGKAKALYDINIGILSIPAFYNDLNMDLIIEIDAYCNILSSHLGKYNGCLNSDQYKLFQNDIKNNGKTALVMLNQTDISSRNMLFTPDGGLKFQLLIIPDYYLGAETLITNLLGSDGIQKITNFINQGGLVFASGKSGYLLELWKVLGAGTYIANQLLSTSDKDCVAKITGCQNKSDDFINNLLCLNTLDSSNNSYSFISSAFFINPQAASNLTIIQTYDLTSTTLRKKNLAGQMSSLTASDKAFLPFASYITLGKGKVFLINGNPLFKGWYNKIFYNYLMLAMSRNVMTDAYVGLPNNIPIPGGEAGYQMDLKISFINLYDTTVLDPTLHIYVANFLSIPVIPSFCLPDSSTVNDIDPNALNVSTHIKCYKDKLGPFERVDVMMKVQVEDFRATQAMTDILISDLGINYIDNETSVTSQYVIGGIRTNAALAALIAGDLNPDPSAFYPLQGKGQYVDNFIGVENKEATPASEFDYVSVVPLISPVVDGSDNTAVARIGEFFVDYYTNRTPQYYFPFRNDIDKRSDFLDWKVLSGIAAVMSVDWDTPVKIGKVLRNSSFPNITKNLPVDAANGNWSTIVDNFVTVLKQIWYPNADIFYEIATQRLLAFIDPNKPEGAKTIYPNGIPDEVKAKSNPETKKRDLIWARNDIYFYDTTEMVQPQNINYTHVISLDRYPKNTDPCKNTFGDAHAKILKEGYFSNENNGLKSHEWSNPMLDYCDRRQVSPEEAAKISNGSIIPIHYLVPVTNSDINYAEDILHFTANSDHTGYSTDYPEVKFIYAHRLKVLSANGQGGRLDIKLPNDVQFINESIRDPVNDSLITYSSGLAFYKTVYDNATKLIQAFYRVGGQASNATTSAPIDIFIEQLNDTRDMTITIDVYNMKFDLSSNQTKFEKHFLFNTQNVLMSKDRFYSLPAVEIHCKLNRSNNTAIMPYESIPTLSRIGVFIQELISHRTVYGAAESHHPTNPGVQSINGGFSMVSNIGTCSVPFASFVTHGSGLLIPNSPRTSRLEWDDIWGRRWISPLRSVFPDIPPVPCPLLNFGMATTFEVTKTKQITRLKEWNSDETLDIRVHHKLHNPYPKYFEITLCKDNEVDFFQDKETRYEWERIFDISDGSPYSFQINSTQAPGSSYHINVGHRSTYGNCYDAEGTVVQAQTLTPEQRHKIATAYLCANTLDEVKMAECAEQLKDIPTVNRRTDDGQSPIWIYSPEVDSYYPKNFIKPKMWDLTAEWYYSDPMLKAQPWHLDNNLPGMDYGPAWNPSVIKPHNVISFPIWKGFGFKISYDFTKSLPRFPQYKGWWSDNLQNKDNTLWAGNEISNDISVDKNTLLNDSMWINARNLVNPITGSVVRNRLKNVHTCLFNQNRVRLAVNQSKGAYINNVYQNNIIPLMMDLTDKDSRYTNFDCTGKYQYSPYNISQLDTVVYTNTIRDGLFFAANLRAGAYETINVVLTMSPLANTKYEGIAKVQDGASFVYWNPANGPNSFLITGSSLSVILATRNDLTIDCEVLPTKTTTFNSVIYHLITVKDPAEIKRQWTLLTYTNNYGFGDATTAVFVGGAMGTKSILSPGDYTIVKISLINNSGFKWNLLGGSVEAEDLGEKIVNANDLMAGKKRAIQKPTKYNFLVLDIPEEIKPYITIVPYNPYLDLTPQYFDFLNVNIMTISDSTSGEFYYMLNVSSSFPASLTGKVYEVNVTLVKSYFDKLPGYKDPTIAGYHDYNLTIPSFKFGIPYADGPYKGKIFYTSGYSSNLIIKASVPNYWNVTQAKVISDPQVTDLRMAFANPDNYSEIIANFWNTIENDTVIITNQTSGSKNIISLNVSKSFPTFPKKNGSNPDIASFNILVKATTPQLQAGSMTVIENPQIFYSDFANKTKNSTIPAPTSKTVTVKGAWLSVSYKTTIVKSDGKGGYIDSPDQRIFSQDSNITFKATLTATNIGSDYAYNVNFSVVLGKGVSVIENLIRSDLNYTISLNGSETILKVNPYCMLTNGDSISETAYLNYVKPVRRRLLQTGALTVIKSISAEIDLSSNANNNKVIQTIPVPLTFTALQIQRDILYLSGTVNDPTGYPIVNLQAYPNPTKTASGKDIRFIFYVAFTNVVCTSNVTSTYGNCQLFSDTLQIIRGLSSTSSYSNIPIPSWFTGKVHSAKITYTAESYDENKKFLASGTYIFNYQRVDPQNNTNNNNNNNNNNQNNQNNPQNNTQNNTNNNPEPINKNNTQNNTNGTILYEKVEESPILPLWAIILIPIIATTLIIIAAIIIIKKYRNNQKIVNASSVTEGTMQEPPIQEPPQYYDKT